MSDAAGPVELEMGYSAVEFARVLPAAMRDWRVTGRQPEWSVSDTGGNMLATIAIQPCPERVMGALRLPVLQVRIAFASLARTQRAELLRRFERGFQRGGG